jgi:hypothetical protein
MRRRRRPVPRWLREVGGQRSGGLDWPSSFEPQHSTLPDVVRPQVWFPPALTVAKIPDAREALADHAARQVAPPTAHALAFHQMPADRLRIFSAANCIQSCTVVVSSCRCQQLSSLERMSIISSHPSDNILSTKATTWDLQSAGFSQTEMYHETSVRLSNPSVISTSLPPMLILL